MDTLEIEKQIKEFFENSKNLDSQKIFRNIKLKCYDVDKRKATFIAEDACTAIYVQKKYSNEMVEALESIVGKPAFVDCIYKTVSKPINNQFNVTSC